MEAAETTQEEKVGKVGTVRFNVYRCRCGRQWTGRSKARPRVCPKCKDANWDKERLWSRPDRKAS